MGGHNRREVPPELVRALKRFRVWRRTRKPKSRIPEPLWALAVELTSARSDGLRFLFRRIFPVESRDSTLWALWSVLHFLVRCVSFTSGERVCVRHMPADCRPKRYSGPRAAATIPM